MNNIELREKRVHGTPGFPFDIEEVISNEEKRAFSPLHFHKEFEFCVVQSGKMTVQVNENYITLSDGEGIFINSGTLHSVLSAENTCGHMIILLFKSDFIMSDKDLIKNRYIVPLINGELSVPEKLNSEECELILQMNDIYENKEFGYELEMKCYATKLMSLLIKETHRKKKKNENKNIEIIKKTIDFIHKNYKNNVTLAEMSAYVFVSPEHLCRVFSQMSDVSPFQYLNRYRIIQSGRMLLNENASISEIASECGFNSSSYFNKMFMRFMGCTPSQYRKNK